VQEAYALPLDVIKAVNEAMSASGVTEKTE